MNTDDFDLIVVGTGFASSFFLSSLLKKLSPTARILVLERGYVDEHAWQIENQKNSRIDHYETFVNKNPEKEWTFSLGFGGGSNCWWANTPRMLPEDFEMQTRYGVGRDWPLSYDDLEPYYVEAENVMAVAGPSDDSPYQRSGPYPQPPHRFTEPDRLFKDAYPDQFFHLPTARPRVATANRPACCATGACNLCPVDAKFTVQNEMRYIYADPRVTLEMGAAVQAVDVAGGVAKGVTYIQEGATKSARADMVALGANALFNPHILLRSGITQPQLGKGLNEQVLVRAFVDLAGVDNYQGSTSHTGIGYMQYRGVDRSERAAMMIITNNSPHADRALRSERGKWRQRLVLHLTFEDEPSDENYVTVNAANPELVETVYKGYSAYTQRSIDALPSILPELLRPLPVERFEIGQPETERHIQGTTVMGNDPESSIVDRYLVHQQVRNLLVLGSSVFPTCPPANPTLTISALSLWAAAHI